MGRGRRKASALPVLWFEKSFELTNAGGMAHLPQRLCFDLADAFAGDLELLADFFKRAAVAVD